MHTYIESFSFPEFFFLKIPPFETKPLISLHIIYKGVLKNGEGKKTTEVFIFQEYYWFHLHGLRMEILENVKKKMKQVKIEVFVCTRTAAAVVCTPSRGAGKREFAFTVQHISGTLHQVFRAAKIFLKFTYKKLN